MEDHRNRLKAWRMMAGLSRDQVGEKVGRTADWVRQLECGYRTIDNVNIVEAERWAAAINLDLVELISSARLVEASHPTDTPSRRKGIASAKRN